MTRPPSFVPNPGPLCPAAAHGQIESVLAGEVHGRDDVGDLLGLQDCERTPVEHAVVHHPRLVVALVRSRDHLPANRVT